MEANYNAFMDRLIKKYEGGYSWHPKDPGGPTNFGITCFDLAEHRGQPMTTMAAWATPVKEMSLSEAENIYAYKYALGIRFNDLKSGIDVVMMDYAVNSGPKRAAHVACALAGHPVTDHVDGDLLKSINACDAEKFITAMCEERLRFMHAIDGGKAWVTFGNGWLTRVTDLKSYALYLARAPRGMPRANPPPEAHDLSHVTTPKAQNVAKTATGRTAGGIIAGGAAAHLAGANLWVVTGVVFFVIAAGIAYEAWQEKKTVAANLKVHA